MGIDFVDGLLSTLSSPPVKRLNAVIQSGCKCQGNMPGKYLIYLPHVSPMPQAVALHKHAHLLHIGLLSAQAIVFITNLLTDLV